MQAPSCIIYLERYSESNLRVPSVDNYLRQHRPWRGDAISFCYNDCLKTTQPQKLLTIKSRLPLCSQGTTPLYYQRASNIGNSHPASCSIIQEYYTANRTWVQSNIRLNFACLNRSSRIRAPHKPLQIYQYCVQAGAPRNTHAPRDLCRSVVGALV